MKKLFIPLCLFFMTGLPLVALPSQILLIRHAEKPQEGNELSVRGWERAEDLVPYFLGSTEIIQEGMPVALIAADQKSPHASVRSIQTLQPLGRELHLEVQTPFKPDQYSEAAKFIKEEPAFQGRIVVIAWQHHALASLAQALGVERELPQWKDDVFDRLWVITYLPDGKAQFQDRPQRLLFGDSPD